MKAGFSGEYRSDYLRWEGGLFGHGIYEFTIDADDPLTFLWTDGTLIRPDHHYEYDKKSSPLIATVIAPKWFSRDSTPKSAAMHDSACRHHGIWQATTGGWEFVFVTRREADMWFRRMIPYENVSKGAAISNWLGVRIGSIWGSWGDNPDSVYLKYKALASTHSQ